MFCVTNVIAATNAHSIPYQFVEKSVEHASITPTVSGISDRYVLRAYRIPKKKRYASTVNSGDNPLMVCTSETGMAAIDNALKICPASEKHASGSAVMQTSTVGYLIPFFSAGTLCRTIGNRCARYANSKHQNDTNANCISVSVMGRSSALRIDLDEVFVSADVMYHTTHSPISLYDTGAFSASAISCAFLLTLAVRVRKWPNVSAMLLWLRA
ncbi:hypothetical protein KEM56_005289, partial [Ascosphaera pollenicola]